MTPERRAKLLSWGKTLLIVVAVVGMATAVNRLVRSYSYDQIATALGSIPASAIVAAITLLVLQHAMLIVREWLAVGYAGRPDLGRGRTALASVVSRSLSSLGVASITGVALRMRIYSGWGLTAGDVAKVTTYNELTFIVGIATQFALAFGVLPVPAALAGWIPVALVRVIGAGAATLVVTYVVMCARAPSEIRIRTLVIPVPTTTQIAGSLVLPVIDRMLDAGIVYLCLPAGIGLSYPDLLVVCLIGSVAGSITQIPAGLGVLEGIVLVFAGASDEAAPFVIGGLLVRRIITDLLPLVVGGSLLVILELRRRADTPRPEWVAQATAALLSTLTFMVGVIVMIVATSAVGDRLGGLGQTLALAVGTAILFVSRGLVRRSRRAWQIAVGLVVLRTIGAVVVPPPLVAGVVLAILGGLLALSRPVFQERRPVIDHSPRWWIAFGIAMAATAWNAFVQGGRQLSREVLVEGGVMIGVAAVAAAFLAIHLVQRSRRS